MALFLQIETYPGLLSEDEAFVKHLINVDNINSITKNWLKPDDGLVLNMSDGSMYELTPDSSKEFSKTLEEGRTGFSEMKK